MKIGLLFFYLGLIKMKRIVKDPGTILAGFVPEQSLDYCLNIHQKLRFNLHIVRPRQTKLGCFSVRPPLTPTIRVNANLNPYSFLVTYIHETAHCSVYRSYKKRVAPHGIEWKTHFQNLMLPLLRDDVFPADVLARLTLHMKNPKASTSGDPVLYNLLKKYDKELEETDSKIMIGQLNSGDHFVFNGRTFVKELTRRTRTLCVEKSSLRKYTIPSHALVEKSVVES